MNFFIIYQAEKDVLFCINTFAISKINIDYFRMICMLIIIIGEEFSDFPVMP